MKQGALIVLVLLVAAAPARAGLFGSSERGTRGAQFLKLGAGARAEGMGEAFTAAAEDASSLYWNPAGLTWLPEHELDATLMHAPYLASSYYDYGAWAQNFGKRGAVGLEVQSFSAGRITQRDEAGASQGSFSPYDVAVSLGDGRRIGDFSVGAAGKFIRSQIVDSAQTVALDLGVMSRWYLNDRLRWGFAADNIGGSLKYENDATPLPRIYRIGSVWRFNERWMATSDLQLPEDDTPAIAIGAERRWKFSGRTSGALRAGFNSRTIGQVDSFTGFTFGAGMTFDQASFDYAFLPMGALGATHRMSISLRFDTVRPPAVHLQRPMSLKGLFCEDFHGIKICHLPNGSFFTWYPARSTRGTEAFENIPSNGALDLVPSPEDLRLLQNDSD